MVMMRPSCVRHGMPVVPKLSIVKVQVLENPDKLVEFRGDLFMSQSSLTDVHTCGISGPVEFSLFTPVVPPIRWIYSFGVPRGISTWHWARWWLLPFFCRGCVALVRSADASAAAELSDGASARLKDAEASNIGRWWVNCIAIVVQVWYI